MRLPLTAAQLLVWHQQQLDLTNPINNVGEYVELRGPLELDLLVSAVDRGVADTDTMNVRFVEEGDQVWQVVEAASENTPPVVDLRCADDPMGRARQWMRERLDRPFDLTAGPTSCMAVLMLAADHHLLFLAAHHIALDGCSGSLLIRRICEIYNELLVGKPVSERPYQGLDAVIAEERRYHGSARYTADREYWLKALADGPLEVPVTGRCAPVSHHSLSEAGSLPADKANALRALAGEARVTVSTVMMAAAGLYVHRVAGVRDVLLSVPVTGRKGSRARNVPSMVMNCLPLRLRIEPHMPTRELLRQTFHQARDLLRHERYQDFARDLDLGDAAYQQCGLEINYMAFDYDMRFGDADTVVHTLSTGYVDDLAISVYDRQRDGSLRILMNANPALYQQEDLREHLRQFLRLVESLETPVLLD
ncbi:condensation domain-containing protein [Pseudonocardia acaciae]|uniref:condensation domain-containing protein n=1 Tax=Pseudonocardia acaciae TaxID=551276 RepID=UPI000490413E|nr:condensation domain-containing protein [Pseudonocardia acaciae]